MKKKIILTVCTIGLTLLAACGSDTDSVATSSKPASESSISADDNALSTSTVEQIEEDTQAVEVNAPIDDNVPTEYKSALNKAISYNEFMYMSKAGLYEQLTSEYGEKFTAEAAQYAVDNLNADWNYNALQNAKNYDETMHMSKAGLYDQLTSEYGEKFTAEEAQYAVDNIEADWKNNALIKAKEYQTLMDMSPAAIYDQLISDYGEKFTAEEAQYAVDNLD